MLELSLRQLQEQVCESIRVEPDPTDSELDRVVVWLPLYYEGGTGVRVWITPTERGWRLTDDGHTFSEIMRYGREALPDSETFKQGIRFLEMMRISVHRDKSRDWLTIFDELSVDEAFPGGLSFGVFFFAQALQKYAEICRPDTHRIPPSAAFKPSSGHLREERG